MKQNWSFQEKDIKWGRRNFQFLKQLDKFHQFSETNNEHV